MSGKGTTNKSLAAEITRSASNQTYYTIRFLVDRNLVEDAYRAYGYFRWVDDFIDMQLETRSSKMAFIHRQKSILQASYAGKPPKDLSVEEQMLATLVRNDSGKQPGLRSYLYKMMTVMEFDAGRQGQVISQAQLLEYTKNLAAAVTDAMYYFIGHDDPAPPPEKRYLAVTAAHITHMLRDTLEDRDIGYFNIPREYLEKKSISPMEAESSAYREWVCSEVEKARWLFKEGRENLGLAKNLRCRLVGFAYSARFEWMLRVIERENYCLRSEYRERKSLSAGLWIGWRTLASMIASPWARDRQPTRAVQTVQAEEL